MPFLRVFLSLYHAFSWRLSQSSAKNHYFPLAVILNIPIIFLYSQDNFFLIFRPS